MGERVGTGANRITRGYLGAVRGLGLLFACVALHAVAQNTCPSEDPDVNYNCPAGPAFVLPRWGNVPWSKPQYWQSIMVGDLDGDGFDELVGRDASGVHLYAFDAAQGVWLPVVTVDGKQELVLPLSDAEGFGVAGYAYQLVDLDGNGIKQLVVRTTAGLTVYKLVPGAPTSDGLKTASWTNSVYGGPFADGGCFPNGLCWNSAPYYQTIRFGDVDGEPGAEVVGWGGAGIEAWKWNGAGWTQLPSPGNPGGDVRLLSPTIPVTLQFAKLEASGGQALVFYNAGDFQGVFAIRFTRSANGGSWAPFPSDTYFPFGGILCAVNESCWDTLQSADLDGNGIDSLIIRQADCVDGAGGVIAARIDPATVQWQVRTTSGPFSDCSLPLPNGVAYYPSIQFGHITGNKVPELLGRLPGGMNVYQWGGGGWTQLVSNTPQLSDPLWAADPSYYGAIRTAKLPGSMGSSLLARGQNGVRTWTYANGTFSRPLSYGGFPALDANTYNAINGFMGLPNGVRNLYTNPTIDTTAEALSAMMSQISDIGEGCQNEISGHPPQYATCQPLPGTTNPTYTQVVNQLVKELWLASQVVDHFGLVQAMTTGMFVNDSLVLPAIGNDLQLQAAANSVGVADYFGLFGSIGELVGFFFPELWGLNATAYSLAALSSSIELFSSPSTAKSSQAYEQIALQIGSLVGEMQNANLVQKHNVLGDYVLLNNVGRFAYSQLWTIDEAGFASVSRQAFALWVYKTMLPTLWQLWNVSNCGSLPVDRVDCTAPDDTANFTEYATDNNGVTSFTALLPPQTPCQTSCPFGQCNTVCQFAPADADIVSTVFTPVSRQCTYGPHSGTSWNYGPPGTGGCTLGVGQEIFDNVQGWSFPVSDLNAATGAAIVAPMSAAGGLNDSQLRPTLRLQLITPLTVDIDLRTVQLKVTRLLRERLGSEELIKRPDGRNFGVSLLVPDGTANALTARLQTGSGEMPRMSAVVTLKPRRALDFALDVNQASIIDPRLCNGAPEKTRLQVSVELSGGGLPQPLVFDQVQDWACVRDAEGALRMLRAAGRPAKNVVFQ